MDGFPTRDISLAMPNAVWPSAKPNQAVGSTQRAPALLTAHYQGTEGSALDPLQADGDEKHPGQEQGGRSPSPHSDLHCFEEEHP